MTLILTRHGPTERSWPEQHLGQRLDLPLSAAGRREARALARRLRPLRFGRVVCSPLRRATETAAIIADGRRIDVDERLIEMDYGAWEGLTYEEVAAADPRLRRRWEADPEGTACPGGESGAQVARRAGAFLLDLLEIAEADDDGTVLAVGHSTFNRILLCLALGVRIRDYRRRFVQDPLNLTVLRWTAGRAAGAQLLRYNETAPRATGRAIPRRP